ncbi:hypothetical protein G9C98_008472 [Cotesia typhae]|uniref:3'-5' exonuclease domain-containing protein n=1 Tax=Cotesia typhae TaxID=2053667 RepID=A0A8J5UVM3_9HYME|nr:hypothetical protein G9C98_008472 [Cotesia typhae]
MKKYCVQLLLIKIIYLILPENASQIERIKQDSTHGYAGEFTLSQAWPHTWCYLFKRLDPKKTCQSTYVDRWSILQFVPRLPSGNYYSECNHSTPFKFDEISQIRAELESRWFSFDAAQNLTDFWKDQWENSGVCGLSNDQTNSQLKYFNKGLELSGKFNMARILSEANIIPGHNYTKQTIVDAVSYVLGDKRAVIACQRHRKTYEYYLLDVLIWFNKDFEPTIRVGILFLATKYRDNVVSGIKNLCKINKSKSDYSDKNNNVNDNSGDNYKYNNNEALVPALSFNNIILADNPEKCDFAVERLRRKILSSYNCVVLGTLDLRLLAERLSVTSRQSLAAMSLQYLDYEMEKLTDIRCSNWDADQLDNDQIQYAATDAIISIFVYHEIMKEADKKKSTWMVMKSHQSHDVLLLCPRCHEISNRSDLAMRQSLARMCNAPLSKPLTLRNDQYHRKRELMSAVKVLRDNNPSIPRHRRKEMESRVLEFTGYDRITPEVTDIVHQKLMSDSTSSSHQVSKPLHGLRVVEYFTKSEKGLVELERLWREHFLNTMKPKYLPKLWSVHHNQERLEIRVGQNRIEPQDAKLAGLR